MQEWVALVSDNGGISILPLMSEKLSSLLKRLGLVACFLLGEHETSDAAYDTFAAGKNEEAKMDEIELIASQMAPASDVII